jgi:membrane protease YdiL (CAAX protease family)
MSANAAGSSQSVERLARLTRLGGILFVVGVAACFVASVAVVGSGGAFMTRPTPEALARVARTPYGLAAGGLFAVGGLAGLAGLAVYVVVPGLDPRLARRDFDKLRTVLGCLVAVFVLANVLTIPVVLGDQGAAVTPSRMSVSSLVVAMLATQAAIMAVLIWRVVRPGALTWEDIGLTTAHLERRLAQGAVGGLVVLFLGVVAAFATKELFGINPDQAQQFGAVRAASPAQFLGIWLMVAVSAPICEESFFRGYVFGALRGRYGRPIAYVGSSLMFAAAHLSLSTALPILVVGLCLAFLYDRTRSVVPGIVAHGLFNAVQMTLLYAGVAS